MHLNPSAARSLEEGLEETLIVHRLRVPETLRRTLANTNLIESAFSVVETVCRNVKRWRPGDQAERWVGSGLLFAESKFRRVRGLSGDPSHGGTSVVASFEPSCASCSGRLRCFQRVTTFNEVPGNLSEGRINIQAGGKPDCDQQRDQFIPGQAHGSSIKGGPVCAPAFIELAISKETAIKTLPLTKSLTACSSCRD
jgi:hypothetical protein